MKRTEDDIARMGLSLFFAVSGIALFVYTLINNLNHGNYDSSDFYFYYVLGILILIFTFMFLNRFLRKNLFNSLPLKILIVVLILIPITISLNNWWHTRISNMTPQSNSRDCPKDQPVKGNSQSGIYHMPSGQFYNKTMPERCFSSEDDAKKAGFRKSMK